MALEEYLPYYKKSNDVNHFFKLVRESGNQKKEATIKRYYYKIRKEYGKIKKPQEYDFDNTETSDLGKYTISHLKKLKLLDFKRFKVKLNEVFLKREGFNNEEINKILGKNDVEKFDTEEEVFL